METDPLKAEADEDFDEDKLSNIGEYQLDTNLFSKDSDYDDTYILESITSSKSWATLDFSSAISSITFVFVGA